MSIDRNFSPLKLAIHPDEEPWRGREVRVLGAALHAWEWQGPKAAKTLQRLVVLVADADQADVLVRWEDDLGMADVEVDDETAGMVTRSQPILGDVTTDTAVPGWCEMRLSRKVFSEMPTSASVPAQHEIGHALGLIHDDSGIMRTSGPAMISRSNRVRAAQQRLKGVVGVTTRSQHQG